MVSMENGVSDVTEMEVRSGVGLEVQSLHGIIIVTLYSILVIGCYHPKRVSTLLTHLQWLKKLSQCFSTTMLNTIGSKFCNIPEIFSQTLGHNN